MEYKFKLLVLFFNSLHKLIFLVYASIELFDYLRIQWIKNKIYSYFIGGYNIVLNTNKLCFLLIFCIFYVLFFLFISIDC